MELATESKLVATYTYTDPEGNPTYKVLRYDPKSFKQRHLSKDGNWDWGLPASVDRQLYHVGKLNEGSIVFIVEGEKDVLSLERIGLIATTSSGGAGFKWYNEETKETQPFVYQLAGKTVIVCGDNDGPGQEHVEDVLKACSGIVAAKHVLKLPDGFKDPTEFLGDFSDERIEAFEHLISVSMMPENSPVRRIKKIIENKGVPDARQSEKLVLGALINGNAHLKECPELTVDDFVGRDHVEIFKAIVASEEVYGSVDAKTVAQSLEDSSKLEDIGGLSYLIELIEELPNSFSVDSHVSILRERSSARQFLNGIIKCSEDMLLGKDMDSVKTSVSQLVNDPRMMSKDSNTFSISEIVGDMDAFLKPKNMGLTVPILPTLFNAMYGLHEGQLVIVAGRPANGKSALAAEIASYAAIQGFPSEVISLEVPKEDDIKKRACQLAKVSYLDVIAGRLNDAQVARFVKVITQLQQKPLRVDDSPGWTLGRIRNHLRRRQLSGNPLRLLVIDYLQLMSSNGKFESKNVEIGAITRGLKLIANEFKITVVLLSQLSKLMERENRKPMLSDLRDSGSIEADCDVCIFVHRDPALRIKYADSYIEPVWICLAKQRNGPVFEYQVSFAKPYALFFEEQSVDMERMKGFLNEL